ncbi:MAG: monovalent cation/H(+) antiporter subunit G [Verrucomicrobiota bacterium]
MISSVLVLAGSITFLVASIGLFRFPDAFTRLHSATVATALGTLLLVIGAAIRFPNPSSLALLAATLFLVFLTAPLACHAITRRVADTQTTPNENTSPVDQEHEPTD